MQFGLKPDTIARINGVLAAHPEIEQAVLYGSRAKGNYRAGSDIDLCLEGDALTLTQLLEIENELDDLLLPYKIDLSLHHALDNPELIDHIRRVGVVFYPIA
ncbi:MAG: nucleotidyltransferase domain-containing protein [Thiobacillus sp.]